MGSEDDAPQFVDARDRERADRWALDPRLVVARRDLRSLSREKTIVLALLIQLFVAAFSSFLVFGLASMYDPGSVAADGVDIAVTGEATDELRAAVAEVSGSEARAIGSRATAMSAFERGQVDAVLHGTYVTPEEGGRIVAVTATVPEGNVRTTLVVVQVRQVLEALERSERLARSQHLESTPLALPDRVSASPYFGFTYTVLVPLLLFLPPFISGSVAVDSITEEIERGTLELLRVAPLSLVDVVDGKALAMIALAPAQVALWIGLLAANGIPIAHPWAILAFVTAVTVFVVVLGLVLGLQFTKRRPAQLLFSVLALLLFGLAVFLPEHPATTVARLAVDSTSTGTFVHVLGAVVAAVALYAWMRRHVEGRSPESL